MIRAANEVRLRFGDESLTEIRRAARWYDRQRRGLGDEFLEALHVRLSQLLESRGLASRVPHAPPEVRVRRILLGRFPYAVVFLETDEEVRVIAVMHGKRKLGYWLGRLKE